MGIRRDDDEYLLSAEDNQPCSVQNDKCFLDRNILKFAMIVEFMIGTEFIVRSGNS